MLGLNARRDAPMVEAVPYTYGLAEAQQRARLQQQLPPLTPQQKRHQHHNDPHAHPVPQQQPVSSPLSATHESSALLVAMDPNMKQRIQLDERRINALKDLDDAKFSSFHFRTILVAGVGFFTDAYDMFAISVAAVMLGLVYRDGYTTLGTGADLALKIATPIGSLVGQGLFGWLSDVYGRKKMYGYELLIIIAATMVQTMAAESDYTSIRITPVLVFWRIIMGVGIGGDYPLSAIITSEFAATRIRGRMMVSVFSNQGLGTFTATIVAVVCVAAFQSGIQELGRERVDPCWRLLIGLGCVPAVIAVYFRLTIPETPRFTMDVERNVLAATIESEQFMQSGKYQNERKKLGLATALKINAPRMSWSDFCAYFGQCKNGKVLLGTAYSWFVLDIAFYGMSFNSSFILAAMGNIPGLNNNVCDPAQLNDCMYSTVWFVSKNSLILAAGGLIPGFIASFLLVDIVGRKALQFCGFVCMAVIVIAMGAAYDFGISGTAFVVLFCLANFMANAGPNTTTFIIPGEVFPTRYRSTAHGISAACGKLGAVIGQVIFSNVANQGGSGKKLGNILLAFGCFLLTGVLSTLLLPETNGRSLEELSNENQNAFVYDLQVLRPPAEAHLQNPAEEMATTTNLSPEAQYASQNLPAHSQEAYSEPSRGNDAGIDPQYRAGLY